MFRKHLKSLEKWSQSSKRKPLLLRGARQVGKTWLVREFAKSFETFVEVNLEAQPELHKHFKESFGKPDVLVRVLELAGESVIKAGSTLLFIDEIQECPEAILALRYFKEKMPELHVIAAGSLLEFALEELSFPVGRIENLYIFPLSFSEFLIARQKADLRSEILKDGPQVLLQKLHDVLLAELRLYMLIGGMPEVVATFLQSENLDEAQSIQQQLITNFRMDFSKYASKAKIPYVRKVFDETPRLLGEKFVYSKIASDVRSRDLGAALELLEGAGILTRSLHSSGNCVPLSSEAENSKFKTFFVDIGLCNRLLGQRLSHELTLHPELIINRGGLAEQFVAQELRTMTPVNAQPELYYWHREAKSSQAEVDFLFEFNQRVVPIEVKSGRSSKMKSLKIFMTEKSSKNAVCISCERLNRQANICYVPLYMIDLLETCLWL